VVYLGVTSSLPRGCASRIRPVPVVVEPDSNPTKRLGFRVSGGREVCRLCAGLLLQQGSEQDPEEHQGSDADGDLGG